MPLPTDPRTPWPPASLHRAYQRYAEHSAWYSGDPTQLALYYAGASGQGINVPRPGFQSWNLAPPIGQGGLINRFLSFFWSRPMRQTNSPTRAFYHVPLPSDIAGTSSDLLFGEPPAFQFPEGEEGASTAVQDRLEEAVEEGGINRVLLEAGEVCAALGGIYLRATWDQEVVPDWPLLTPVHPDAAVPEFRWGVLTAVTFWREVAQDGQKVYRHLERHEPGYMLHGLYEGTRDHLGEAIGLDSLPETTGFEPVIETGLKQLTAAYIPNMRPNRCDRSSELGRSDYDGSEDLFDALDEVYTSLMRDIRLGRGRVIVPSDMLDSQGKGKGATFDLDREVYEGMQSVDPKMGITLNQFEIRTEQHLVAAGNLVEQIIRGAGYSANTFGLQGDTRTQPATATEIQARERRTFVTRGRKMDYWTPALQQILFVYLQLDAALFNGPGAAIPRIEWSDAVVDDVERTAQTVNLLEQARAASTEVKVRMVHPDWTDEEVAREVQLIKDDQGASLPDPTQLGGQPALPPDQPGMSGMPPMPAAGG